MTACIPLLCVLVVISTSSRLLNFLGEPCLFGSVLNSFGLKWSVLVNTDEDTMPIVDNCVWLNGNCTRPKEGNWINLAEMNRYRS